MRKTTEEWQCAPTGDQGPKRFISLIPGAKAS